MPTDVGPSPTIFEDTDAEVMLRDGSWVWCQVIGQRQDRHGRWGVGIRYYPNATIGESGGWYLYDPQRIRPLPTLAACLQDCLLAGSLAMPRST
jgi:hypothetical protein